MIKNDQELDTLRSQIRRFTTINGIMRAAKMLGVSPNTLKNFLVKAPIRPSSLEKIYDNFMR